MATVALSGIITPTNVVTATSTTTLTNKTLTGAVMNGTLGATTPSTGAFTSVTSSGVTNSFGSATNSNVANLFSGTKTGYAMLAVDSSTLSPAATGDAGIVFIQPAVGNTIQKASTGTHANFASLWVAPPAIGAGASTLTNASAIYVSSAPSGATNNYAISVGSGTSSFNGLVDISGASGGQIKFPATQNASTNANTLDDYEEGTFTPTLVGFSTAGTTTYSAQTGLYTKIGRQVTYIVNLVVTATTGTGAALLGGFPFTFNSTVIPVAAMDASALNWTGGTYLIVMPEGDTTTAYIFGEADDANRTTQNLTNETQVIRFTLTHFV
jgi:hypothetical protein